MSYVQQIIAGAHQGGFEVSPAAGYDLSYGLITGTASRLTFQTKQVTGETTHSDYIEVSNVAKASIAFYASLNSNGSKNGAGFAATNVAGSDINFILTNSDGTQLMQIVGIANRTSGPAGSRGAELTLLTGLGNVTTSTDVATTKAEFPTGFSLAIGGFTFLPDDITVVGVDAYYAHKTGETSTAVQVKRCIIGGATDYWGNSSTYFTPADGEWAASTVYSSGTTVIAPNNKGLVLVTVLGGTSGSAIPDIDVNLDDDITDNTAVWTLGTAQDIYTAEATWTDSTASSGGTGSSKIIDHNIIG